MNQLEAMRHAGNINQQAIECGFEWAIPGRTLLEIDRFIEWRIRSGNCKPAFKNYQPPGASSPFPATACISPNDVVVHGIPGDYIIQPGDLLTIDVGTEYNGWFVDAARSRVIPGASTQLEIAKAQKAQYLIDATEAILNAQLAVVRDECTLLELATAAELTAAQYGVIILPQWGGHAIGNKIHMDPFIPNTIDRSKSKLQQQLESNKFARITLYEGETICLEPVVSFKSSAIMIDVDMWTVRKADGELTAHTERCLVVTKNGFEILS